MNEHRPLVRVVVRGSARTHLAHEGDFLTLCGHVLVAKSSIHVRHTMCRRCLNEAHYRDRHDAAG